MIPNLLFKIFIEFILYNLLGKKLTHKLFITPYKDLSKEIWILTLVTLINRVGAMVIPFLSLYLTKSLGFSLYEVSLIMLFYGLGSLFGSWTGGKLTDKIGYHKVMYTSLFLSGFLFFSIQLLTTFVQFAAGIFILTFVTDVFRPAIYVAMSSYSTKENRTRSISLIRIVINLGYAIGPAFAGLMIAKVSYSWLFWIDGLTAILASLIIYKYLFQKEDKVKEEELLKKKVIVKPYKDVHFILFWIIVFLCGVSFVQFIEVWPLYYDKMIHLEEYQIGLVLALNGFIIFLLEMPIVDYVDKKFKHINLMLFGLILFALSFFVLSIDNSIEMVIISMILISVGEIFCFPFSNTYALDLAKKGNEGEYMAFYTMTFSAAFIVGPLGMIVVEKMGFDMLWYFATVILIISLLLVVVIKKKYK